MLEALSSIRFYDFRSVFDWNTRKTGRSTGGEREGERERGVGGGIKWVQRRPQVFYSDDDYSEQLT